MKRNRQEEKINHWQFKHKTNITEIINTSLTQFRVQINSTSTFSLVGCFSYFYSYSCFYSCYFMNSSFAFFLSSFYFFLSSRYSVRTSELTSSITTGWFSYLAANSLATSWVIAVFRKPKVIDGIYFAALSSSSKMALTSSSLISFYPTSRSRTLNFFSFWTPFKI